MSLAKATLDAASLDRTIVLGARLPRVLLASAAGGGLALTGVAFQAVLGNPLAEPYVLGVSGGAALGATLAIAFGFTATSLFGASVVPAMALLGGLGATALVYSIARPGGVMTRTSMLLAGVVVNAIASAAITFVKTLVAASQAQELLFWLMGFLDVPSWTQLGFVTFYVAVGAAHPASRRRAPEPARARGRRGRRIWASTSGRSSAGPSSRARSSWARS